jgi:hypothetical protein
MEQGRVDRLPERLQDGAAMDQQTGWLPGFLLGLGHVDFAATQVAHMEGMHRLACGNQPFGQAGNTGLEHRLHPGSHQQDAASFSAGSRRALEQAHRMPLALEHQGQQQARSAGPGDGDAKWRRGSHRAIESG